MPNLLIRLDKDDPCAVRAAARLGVQRAVEPLRELLGSADGDTRDEILTALRTLVREPPRDR